MKRLALFICTSWTILWNFMKLCMDINICYAVILGFHTFHLRGQTKVAYLKICHKTSSFICISGSMFWNLTKPCKNVNIGYAVILPFHAFHTRGKINVAYVWICFKYPFQDIFKHTYRNIVFRDYILTSALYTVHTRD